jgi:hypothetical protein
LPAPTPQQNTMQQKMNITTDEKEHRTDNSGFAKKRVQWLIEHSTSLQLLWCIDSLILQISQLRQAPARYRQTQPYKII